MMDFLIREECEGLDSVRVGWYDSLSSTMNTGNTGAPASESLRGLHATRDFQPNQYICAIPFTATLLIDESLSTPQQQEQRQDDEGFVDTAMAEIQHGLAFVRRFLTDPKWKPYIDCIPLARPDPSRESPQSFPTTPDWWSDEAIQLLPVPLLRESCRLRKKLIRQVATEEQIDPAILQWAVWVTRSRGFTTIRLVEGDRDDLCLLRRTFLIPLLDMINHQGDEPNAEIEPVENGIYDESLFALVARSPIKAGEPITIAYGTGMETSLDLLDRYGFWTANSVSDSRLDWSFVDLPDLNNDIITLNSTDLHKNRKAMEFRNHLKQLRSLP